MTGSNPRKVNNLWLWIAVKLGIRDNEYDDGIPGPSRPMVGLAEQMPPDMLKAFLEAKVPEEHKHLDALIMSTRVAPANGDMINAKQSLSPAQGHQQDAPPPERRS